MQPIAISWKDAEHGIFSELLCLVSVDFHLKISNCLCIIGGVMRSNIDLGWRILLTDAWYHQWLLAKNPNTGSCIVSTMWRCQSSFSLLPLTILDCDTAFTLHMILNWKLGLLLSIAVILCSKRFLTTRLIHPVIYTCTTNTALYKLRFSASKHLINILTHWHSHSDGYFEVNSGLGILPKGTLICKLGEHSSPRGIEPSTPHLVDNWLYFWRPSCSYCFSIQSNNFFFFPQVYLSLCWEIFYRHWDLL